MEARLAGPTDLAGFRAQVGLLLAQQVPPEAVQWQLEPPADPYSDLQSPHASRPRHVARAAVAIVPASFTRLCEFVVLHRDGERFALLYRLLWRLVHEPQLRGDPFDADMLQAQHMAHAVRRDIHKMKADLRLHPLCDARGQDLQAGRHEPAHRVVEVVAPWFARRIAAPRWVVFTPDRSVRCAGGRLLFGPGVPSGELPGPAATDAQWLACYERVFAACDRAAAPQ
jgi:DNA polymerase